MPLGIHDCDLPEIEGVCVYNSERRAIWQGFLTFIELIKTVSELNIVYVDGGFVTDNPHPNDVDIIIEYPDSATRYRLRENNWFLRLRGRVLDRYTVDVLGCLLNEPSPNMIDFSNFSKWKTRSSGGYWLGHRKAF